MQRQTQMSMMNFEDMKRRYNDGEDSLELALDKWDRILNFSRNVFHISHYQEILKAAVVPIFLCAEYANQCHLCPIFTICKQGHSDDWTSLMRVLQAYAIAGDLLPHDPLVGQLERFVDKIKLCQQETVKRMH